MDVALMGADNGIRFTCSCILCSLSDDGSRNNSAVAILKGHAAYFNALRRFLMKIVAMS